VTVGVLKSGVAAGFLLACVGTLAAQSCTTQAKMSVDARNGLADAGLSFANEVKSADVTSLQSSAIAEYASNFGATKTLVMDTSNKLAGDSLSWMRTTARLAIAAMQISHARCRDWLRRRTFRSRGFRRDCMGF
jgi:hypothetical protein